MDCMYIDLEPVAQNKNGNCSKHRRNDHDAIGAQSDKKPVSDCSTVLFCVMV